VTDMEKWQRSIDKLTADNIRLEKELAELQELLAKLLTDSTVLVSKGGVASYKMVLTVGEFVDLCRAAGVEV
jgi:hypothetical protein